MTLTRAGKASGGTLYVFDPQRLYELEKIDLGGDAEALCLRETTTAPVRPHMVLFNRSRTHGKMYVNSGGGTAANMAEFDVNSFSPAKFWKLPRPAPPNTPARTLVFSDDDNDHTESLGATLTRFGRYLWGGRPDGQRIVVLDTWKDEERTRSRSSARCRATRRPT